MEAILSKLNAANVRYVVIGGQAMMQEGMPRFTLDWDIFVPQFDQENFDKINAALADELDMDLEPMDIRISRNPKLPYGYAQWHDGLG